MATICGVFRQLATCDVEILLDNLAAHGFAQTKTKTDILTWNTHSKVEYLAVAMFF